MSFRIFFSHPAVMWGLEVCSGSARCYSKKLPWFLDVSPREAIYLASHRSCTPLVLSDFWISCLHQPEITLAKSRGCAGCNATWNLGVKSIVSTIRGKQPITAQCNGRLAWYCRVHQILVIGYDWMLRVLDCYMLFAFLHNVHFPSELPEPQGCWVTHQSQSQCTWCHSARSESYSEVGCMESSTSFKFYTEYGTS